MCMKCKTSDMTCVFPCVFVFQILACVFVHEMQQGFCWVIQLFSLVCTVKGYYDRKCFNIALHHNNGHLYSERSICKI